MALNEVPKPPSSLPTEQELMASWQGNLDEPLLTIKCITYNHASYIRDALHGFLTQRTNFPFRIVVHDDASTDGTQEVIKHYSAQYPHVIKAVLQETNLRSRGIKRDPYVDPLVTGEYIAICEGDDYWVDPHKLQRQVQFLSAHPDYTLCWTRFFTIKTLNGSTGDLTLDKNGHYFADAEGVEFDFELFERGWHIGMQTLVYRRSALSLENRANKHYRDVFLIADLLTTGRGYCLAVPTAIYRQHPGGIYSGASAIERSAKGAAIYREIFLTYPQNPHLRDKYRKFSGYLIRTLLAQGSYKQALQAVDELTAAVPDSAAHREHLYELLESLFSAKDRQLEDREKRLSDLQASASFRIGRVLTSPLRLARDLRPLSSRFFWGLMPQSVRNKRMLKQRGVVFINKRRIARASRGFTPLPPLDPNRKPKIIVSLTSFPPRIDDAFFAVCSLLDQSLKPDRLILWLAEDQFPGRAADLPRRLIDLQRLGLEVRWCEDIKSYKKLVPALREFPDDIIVTADDDLYYFQDWLLRLIESYRDDPRAIHCHRAHRIAIDGQGNPAPYKNWSKNKGVTAPSFLNFATGGAGCLYPPNALHRDVRRSDLFMELCPNADDVWFWAMAVLGDSRIRVVENRMPKLVYIDPARDYGFTEGPTLSSLNVWNDGNDPQIENVIAFYSENYGLRARLAAEVGVGAEASGSLTG